MYVDYRGKVELRSFFKNQSMSMTYFIEIDAAVYLLKDSKQTVLLLNS